MAKLCFKFGTMGSSKTADLLMTRYNYMEKGRRVLTVKPDMENRDGEKTIKSRIGIEAECILFSDLEKSFSDETFSRETEVILVDEAQFLSAENIDFLASVVDFFSVTVICYGLKTDFTGHLFEGSKRLLELADVIEELPVICWCGKKAHFNARVKGGKVVREGPQVMLGGNETYTALCRKHFLNGDLGPNSF